MSTIEIVDTPVGRRSTYLQLDGTRILADVCRCGDWPSLECPIDDHQIEARKFEVLE